jgi:DGQHR domain-containing protein
MAEIVIRRALELAQREGTPLYLFAVRPNELERLASISRVSRSPGHELVGYQRAEVRQHVEEIREYLDTAQVLFPNALILAFEERLVFKRSRGPSIDDGLATGGTLDLPLAEGDEPRPAWIVDGQQRALALSRTTNQALAVPVAAFVGANISLQRDQFLRINNARPLPRSLITELLPEVDTFLPRRLATKKLPSAIADVLSRHPESPFVGLIRRPSTSKDERTGAVVADNSVVEMIRDRVQEASGCLFPYRNVSTGETDTEVVLRVLIAYWSAVRSTFPTAWGLPPTKSRLMHGAGIKAMGNLMDAIIGRLNPFSPELRTAVEGELARIAPLCRWTDGNWEGLQNLPWNQVENTGRSIKLISNYLLREYLLAVHQR